MIDVFDFYRDPAKANEFRDILTLGVQRHPSSLGQSFLEKDIWVVEVLRLVYDEGFVGSHSTAFKGGTALSKCWKAIERFSEDIDISIHWSDLAGEADEDAAWDKTTRTGSQDRKFRKRQAKILSDWSGDLVARLNARFSEYEIPGLRIELEPDSKGEKVNVPFHA